KETGTARYKGTTCTMSEYVVAFDEEESINIMEINTEDQVTLNLYGGRLVSVVVELGHGYVRLDNQDTYVGGLVEIGYDVIVPVTTDMLLTVREGTYTLRINKNGYSQSKEVTVTKGKETLVDLTSIAIPTGTMIFEITPADATLYINGEKQSSHSFTSVYGTYSIKIEAEGYDTFRGSVKLSNSLKSYDVQLVKIDDEDTEEDTEDSEEDTEDTEEDTEDTEKDTEDSSSSDTTEDTGTTESEETTDNVIWVNQPAGVSVYVDGEYIGIAPVSFPKTVGSHTITLYQTGYLIKSYTIYASNNGKDDEYSFADLTSILDTIE
ncbi:MAG: PEGA domain-containing protein, partial [Lachnospiraceae bacterium]|nr:PEGA domain-containing protein [Lachnospiraceae bacterium]